MTRRALVWRIALAFAIAFVGAAVFFAATGAGLRLLWPYLARSFPGELVVESVEGKLIGPIHLRGLRYRDSASLTIERLEFDWRPAALLAGKLNIKRLHVDGVALALPPSSNETKPRAPFAPPKLPLALSVADARLNRVSVTPAAGEPVFLDSAGFDFHLDRQALELESLEARAPLVHLTARGRVGLAQDIDVNLHTRWSAAPPGYEKIHGSGSVTGRLTRLRLDQRLESPGDARLQAVLHDWPANARWEARLQAKNLGLRQIKAAWPELIASIDTEASGDFQDWRLEGKLRLKQDRQELDGTFALRRAPGSWSLDRLEIRAPDKVTRMAATGHYRIGPAPSLALDVRWRELAWPFTGEAAFASREGRLRITGSPERYRLRLEAAAGSARMPSGDWIARAHGDPSQLVIDHVAARLLDGRLTGRGRIAWRPDFTWQLALAGESLDPGRHWHDWPGQLAFQADTRGGLHEDRLQADFAVSRARGELRGQPFDARGGLHVDGENYRLDDFRVDIGQARVRAAGALTDRWDLEWEARADDLATLSPARGALAVQGRATGARAAPRIIATGKVKNFALKQRQLARLDAGIDLDVQPEAQGLTGRLMLALDDGGRAEARLRLPNALMHVGTLKSQPLEGEVTVRLNRLEMLSALFTDLENTRGTLRADLALGGTLGEPRIAGRATLADGTARLPRLGLTLQDIRLTAESDAQNQLRFEGRLRSGGELRFNGRVQWPAENTRDWSAELALRGERVEVSRTPEAWVLASPDLRLRARPRRVDINGEIGIPEAKIEPLQTDAAVPISRDVILVNAPDDSALARASWDLYSEVRIVLGDKVRFRGFGLSGNITGSVTAADDPARVTTGGGELKIIDGKYKAYGRELEIERGRLIFAGGPIENPGIDARAVRRVGEVTAGIGMRGTLKSPVFTLFSEPPMSQADALSYLIIGQPLEQASSAEGRNLVGAASALTLTGGNMLARQIGARFGFEQVAIEAGETPEEASLVVGRYLSPKLFVAYSVGLFEQINLLRLRYQLSSRWTVQTETGTHSGADLLYTIER